tara:strand:- start:1524 stop:3041 length:1518 start_codon:yes stop_codon:yes gene_type:complete
MAYFNHAFGKGLYLKVLKNAPTVGGVTQTSANLTTAGDFAFIGADYKVLSAAGIANVQAGFYLAQGAFMANDKIGNNPGHGGYKETTKSKMIMKKYISDMWITECNNEAAGRHVVQIAPILSDSNSAGAVGTVAKSCFPCGKDPILRVDVKGTAALRLLNHNAYQSLSGSLPMPNAAAIANASFPANGVDMCCLAQDLNAAGTTGHSGIAPSIVAINFRDQFNNDPIMSKLGTATLYVNRLAAPTGVPLDLIVAGSAQEMAIYNGGARGVVSTTTGGADTMTGIAANATGTTSFFSNNRWSVVIDLFTSCQLQTQWTACTFDTRDFYLLGGLSVAADLQDEVGEPCVACQGFVVDGAVGANAYNARLFTQRRTSADTAINDILLTENYRQSPYNQGNRDSQRMREQEGMSGIVTELGRDGGEGAAAACNGKYKIYHLLHNVPRFNNPSGVFDNDQYHYRVYTPCSGGVDIDSEWLNIAVDAGVRTFDGGGIVSTVADLVEKGGNI